MASTKRYLNFNNVHETVEWTMDISKEDLITLLLTAAEIPPALVDQVMLKLKTSDGFVLPISANIPTNTEETRYSLTIQSDIDIAEAHTSLTDDVNQIRGAIGSIKNQIEDLKQTRNAAQPRSFSRPHRIWNADKYVFTEETKANLKRPSFDSWQWEENEIMGLLAFMFQDLNLLEEFKIDLPVLKKFLQSVKGNYNDNPFHNFRHCFCVAQMMYGVLYCTDLVNKLKPIDKLILLVSCIGHDLDHPGYNNAYQVNAQTRLAVIYNDTSVLENHHAAVLFTLLQDPDINILKNVSDQAYRDIRKGIIRCILATDMSKHGEIMGSFKKHADNFNIEDPEQKNLLLQMIIKCADISNEVRPSLVAEPWVDLLLEEFFSQSDHEKAQGLPTAPFMDREKVTKPAAQVGFIGFVMIPLFELMAKVLPSMEAPLITPIRQSLAYYKQLLDKIEVKK